MRKNNPINFQYFSSVDSEEKAYFTGLLLADGSVHKNRIAITLKLEDRAILDKLRLELNCWANVIEYIPQTSKFSKGNKYAKLAFYSSEISHDLRRLGVVPRKSLDCTPPVVDDSLQRHLIRGIFDGDGCIHVGRNKGNRIYLCGSPQMTDLFSRYSEAVSGNKGRMTPYRGIWYCNIPGRDALKVLESMYNVSNLFLDRKYKKYREMDSYYG